MTVATQEIFILKAIPNPEDDDASRAAYSTRDYNKPWSYDPNCSMLRRYTNEHAAYLAASTLMMENTHWRNVRGYQVCKLSTEQRKDRVW